MMPPFVKIGNKGISVKLNRELYSKELISNLSKVAKDKITSVKSKNGYYFVELSGASQEDYLDFLNYLIFLQIKNG